MAQGFDEAPLVVYAVVERRLGKLRARETVASH